MSATNNKIYGLTILGATGFTGQFAIEHLLERLTRDSAKEELHKLLNGKRIAAAARSLDKLRQKKDRIWQKYITKLDDNIVEFVQIDATNADQLKELAKKSTVLINCVGPFLQYGEAVVRACLEAGDCQYVDITGEPQFIRAMHAKYHEEAERKQVKIIPACGFDSIPADEGVLFTLSQLPSQQTFWLPEGGASSSKSTRTEISIDGYLKADVKGGISGGTYHTLINSFESFWRKSPAPKKRTDSGKTDSRPHKKRGPSLFPRWNAQLNSYVLPFPTADPTVVGLSSRLNRYFLDGQVPVEYGNYLQIKKWYNMVILVLLMAAFMILSYFNFGVVLLRKLWRQPGEGSAIEYESVDRSTFVFEFLCNAKSLRGDHTIHATVAGSPSYRATGIMVVECALMLLQGPSALPKNARTGGVLTPSSAFGISLIQRFHKLGIMKFEVKKVGFAKDPNAQQDSGVERIERELKQYVYME